MLGGSASGGAPPDGIGAQSLGTGILDPRLLSAAEPHPDPPRERIPPQVRDFGHIPSLDDLEPGDLLLVGSLRQGIVSKAIQRVQYQAGFHHSFAEWTHAAVYVGNELVCESGFHGVRHSSIYRYCAGMHRLRFRRPVDLGREERTRIALQAALRLGHSYGFRSILKLLWQARTGWQPAMLEPRNISRRAVICSQLYADAYATVALKSVDEEAFAVSPAHLAASVRLVDVPMKWLSLAGATVTAGIVASESGKGPALRSPAAGIPGQGSAPPESAQS